MIFCSDLNCGAVPIKGQEKLQWYLTNEVMYTLQPQFFHFYMCFLEVITGVHRLAVPAQSAQKYCMDTTALKLVREGRKSTVQSLLS